MKFANFLGKGLPTDYGHFVAVIVMVFSSAEASASGNAYSTVSSVRVDASGKAVVTFSGILTGTLATCMSGDNASSLAFDVNAAGGKGLLSVALSAKATGLKLKAKGTDACTTYPTMEDMSWASVE